MNLPIINSYKKVVTSPISGTKYQIRPYLVGEEKALLIAAEAKDKDGNPDVTEIQNAVKNLISACCGNVDLNSLSSTEIEFLFLEIRKISADESVTLKLRHDCDHVNDVTINLNDITVSKCPDPKVILDEQNQVGVKMKVPSLEDIESVQGKTNVERGFNLIVKSIDYIFSAEEVFPTSEISDEDLHKWVDHLNDAQLQKLSNFVENMPKLELDISYTCGGCKKKVDGKVQGLQNFLG